MPTSPEAEQILANERRALDEWAKGNPAGYFEGVAEDATYFDDIGATSRIAGREAIQEYGRSLSGMIPEHRYELVDPEVQVYGDLGILTLGYRATSPDGTPLPPWRASVVYRREGPDWVRVHLHWSVNKHPPAEA